MESKILVCLSENLTTIFEANKFIYLNEFGNALRTKTAPQLVKIISLFLIENEIYFQFDIGLIMRCKMVSSLYLCIQYM